MRTLLYVPGNKRTMIQKAPTYGADIVVLDLEDSIPPTEKAAARATVEEAIRRGELGNARVVVRINGLNTLESTPDLKAVAIPGVWGLRIPKVETPGEIRELDAVVEDLERHAGLEKGTIRFLPIVESPLGVLRAYEIATASNRVVAISVGAEDLAVALGTQRSSDGLELRHARGHLVLCAAAAGVAAVDTVYSNLKDEAGLVAETRLVKQMGFSGKSVIHPMQIAPIHRVFAPSPEEVEKARRIVEAYEQAEGEGSGALAVDGHMVDLPVVARARRILALAGGR